MQLHSLLLQVPTALYDEPFLDNTPHPAINRSEEDVVLFNSRSFVRLSANLKSDEATGEREAAERTHKSVVDWWWWTGGDDGGHGAYHNHHHVGC